jgi:hypothetical protein
MVSAKLDASSRNQRDRVLPGTGHWHCPLADTSACLPA